MSRKFCTKRLFYFSLIGELKTKPEILHPQNYALALSPQRALIRQEFPSTC